MRYRMLGKTGLEVSVLAFGCAPLGDIFGPVDEAEGERAVHYAVDHGITYFDVAPLYGFTLAEERLGRALRGRRDRVVLATKCCRDTFLSTDYSRSRVLASVEESLRRLRTDYVDVLQIHDVEFARREQIIEETIPAAREAQKAGKCRFVGITGLPVRYLRLLAERIDLDTVLCWGHYNLVENELDEELAPLCEQKGTGLLSASPFLQRLLTRAGAPDWHRSPKEVLEIAPRLAETCRRYGVTLEETALRFALDYPRAATTIVGMSDVKEVAADIASTGFTIPPGLLDELRVIAAPVMNMMWYEGLPENNIPPSDPSRHIPRPPLHTHQE